MCSGKDESVSNNCSRRLSEIFQSVPESQRSCNLSLHMSFKVMSQEPGSQFQSVGSQSQEVPTWPFFIIYRVAIEHSAFPSHHHKSDGSTSGHEAFL